ncbi:hypothetical protein V8C86DRAFT_2489840, partial [Haematococcus lacustris]
PWAAVGLMLILTTAKHLWRRARGSRVPWDDQQDELFAELYAQTFAQVQGKTNGDKMGEMLSASVNENSARLGGRKMPAAQALNRAAYAKAGCAAVWKWNERRTGKD